VHAVAITMDFKMFFLGLIKGLRFTWNSQFIYESMFNNNFNICRSEKESRARVDRVISNVFEQQLLVHKLFGGFSAAVISSMGNSLVRMFFFLFSSLKSLRICTAEIFQRISRLIFLFDNIGCRRNVFISQAFDS
jgi:hypothetical protein